MTEKNSQTVYRSSTHKTPFQFLHDEDYDVLQKMSLTKRNAELIEISTDLYILLETPYLAEGADVAVITIAGVRKPIRFAGKQSQCFPEHLVSYTHARESFNVKSFDTSLEVSNGMIRVDRFLVLEREWWLPVDMFINASELEDGRYTCRVHTSNIRNGLVVPDVNQNVRHSSQAT